MLEHDTNPTPLPVAVAVIEEKLRQVDIHLEATDLQIEAMKRERTNALIWGLIVLGTGFVGLFVWIFNLVAGHK